MKKAATPKEKRYMDSVASLGCVVCRNTGNGQTPALVHHIRTGQGAGQRASNYLTLPLCPIHHMGSGSGVSYHDDSPAFERMYGSELDLLAQTIGEVYDD